MNSKLWYTWPAQQWIEGFPLGNGALGAMLLGGVEQERLALNHEWLWRAKGRFRDAPDVSGNLDRVRAGFFAGDCAAAGEQAMELLIGPTDTPKRVDPFVPAGDLTIAFPHRNAFGWITDYARELDLDTAVATVSYRYRGASFRREAFVHSALPVIVLRATGDGGAPSFVAGLSRTGDPECRLTPWSAAGRIGLEGALIEGSRFAVEVRSFGGAAEVRPDQAVLAMSAGAETLLLLSIAVAHNGEDARALCARQLDAAPPTWRDLLTSHRAEHQRRFRRATIDLGAGRNDLPTDRRIEAVRAGESDPALFALFADFGRYLLISTSRPGGLPANLQGVWNEEIHPPWECDFHHDINLEMNYWPAEPYGLGDLVTPLFDHVERFVPHAREMARKLYGCNGFVLPLQTDCWGRATVESRNYALWTGAAAWLAQHYWERYAYSLDVAFLRERAYPILKEIAAFYASYLIRDRNGFLVTVPSQSPENHFIGGGQPVSLCIGATMDFALIRDLLDHAIRAAEILETDADLRAKWRALLDALPPYRIGRHGQVQEWMEDFEEGDPGHRHFSHLLPLFPGDAWTPEETPDLTRAARATIERRLAAGSAASAWSRAWVVCLMARLRDAESAYQHLRTLLLDHTMPSLLTTHPRHFERWYPAQGPAAPIFQIDGNFGGAAAVAEMLLQSHRGLLRILPALPSAWPSGRATGLRARGGFEVDIAWERGQARAVAIVSHRGGRCRVCVGERPPRACARNGAPVPLIPQNDGAAAFDTVAGERYHLAP